MQNRKPAILISAHFSTLDSSSPCMQAVFFFSLKRNAMKCRQISLQTVCKVHKVFRTCRLDPPTNRQHPGRSIITEGRPGVQKDAETEAGTTRDSAVAPASKERSGVPAAFPINRPGRSPAQRVRVNLSRGHVRDLASRRVAHGHGSVYTNASIGSGSNPYK